MDTRSLDDGSCSDDSGLQRFVFRFQMRGSVPFEAPRNLLWRPPKITKIMDTSSCTILV